MSCVFLGATPGYRTDLWINLGAFFKEFYFSLPFGTAAKAQDVCKLAGGTLFEPMDSRVRNAVIDHARRESLGTQFLGDFWLGVNDKNNEGSFVYNSNDMIVSDSFLNWEPPNPDGLGAENCVTVKIGNEKWNDRNCDIGDAQFVCESKSFLILSIQLHSQ